MIDKWHTITIDSQADRVALPLFTYFIIMHIFKNICLGPAYVQ